MAWKQAPLKSSDRCQRIRQDLACRVEEEIDQSVFFIGKGKDDLVHARAEFRDTDPAHGVCSVGSMPPFICCRIPMIWASVKHAQPIEISSLMRPIKFYLGIPLS